MSQTTGTSHTHLVQALLALLLTGTTLCIQQVGAGRFVYIHSKRTFVQGSQGTSNAMHSRTAPILLFLQFHVGAEQPIS